MTDEDTDDDRMERADRIRRMREGRRGRTDGAGEAETVEATDDGDSPAENGESDGTAPDEVADADDAGGDESASDSAAETDDDADSSPTVDGTTDPEPAETEAESVGSEGAGEAAATDAVDETTPDASGFEFEGSNGDGGATATDDATEELTVDAESDAATDGASTADTATDDAAALAETQTGVAESVATGDAETAVAGLGGGATFAIPDQATTVAEDDDAIDAEGTVAAARAAAGRRTAATYDRTRVLEFELGDERFCLDIDYIEEIVELENMTRVPNSPSYVEGVVDLRGQVTAIINPKDALDVGDEDRGDLIIVFDSEQMDEQGHLGWVVDEVRQVTPVAEDEVNESPDEDAEHINGVINREDEDDFVVWTTPELALQSS